MPLTFAKVGEEKTIKKIQGKIEIQKFLENLGFISGNHITIIAEINGNVIVIIKETRVAISKEMASKIYI